MNLKNAVGGKHSVYSWHCIASVGANSFARTRGYVRMNSHLRPLQLRFPRMKRQIGIIISLLLLGAASLSLAAPPIKSAQAQEETEQASHQGTGKVVSVDRAKLRIKLAHEPIKSLGWSAMMMDFSVVKASLLDGIKEGDAVQFELGKTKPDELIWVIVKLKHK